MAAGRKTGGRKPGTPNKASAARAAAIAASGLSPLDFLLSVLRDTKQELPIRIEAARAAAAYVHPKLAAVTVTGGLDVRHDITAEPMSEAEWEAQHIASAARGGGELKFQQPNVGAVTGARVGGTP